MADNKKTDGAFTYFLSSKGYEAHAEAAQKKRIEQVGTMQDEYASGKFAVCDQAAFLIREGKILARIAQTFDEALSKRLTDLREEVDGAKTLCVSSRKLVCLSARGSAVSVDLTLSAVSHKNTSYSSNASYATVYGDSVFYIAGGKVNVSSNPYSTSVFEEISRWTDLAAVYPASSYVVGCTTEGELIATSNCSFTSTLTEWSRMQVKDLIVLNDRIISLFNDGTVEQKKLTGPTEKIWTGIVSIAASGKRLYGLRSDGTVVMKNIAFGVTDNEHISALRGIVAIAANGLAFAALDASDKLYIAASSRHTPDTWPTEFPK